MGMFDNMAEAAKSPPPGTDWVWSEEQDPIFQWFTEGRGNLIVRARAGTGKTTTIMEGVRRAPEHEKVLCAFNKRIADELNYRLMRQGGGGQARTLHSIGAGIVRQYKERLNVLDDKTRRAKWLTRQVVSNRCPDPIFKLVTVLHSKAREIDPHAVDMGDLDQIMDRFDLHPEEQWAKSEWNSDYVQRAALKAMEVAANVESGDPNGIDFADMIFLPVRHGWMAPTVDLVVVDEAQDMTTAQLELAQGICRGRIAIVGDDRQAIYGFRGADSGSLDRLKRELKAKELGLTTTYRCGKSIVRLAQRLVPDFKAGPNNPEGEVRKAHPVAMEAEVQPGDFVLSRLNAPLMSIALGALRTGKKAKIAGRDFGKGIQALVRRLAQAEASTDLIKFVEAVRGWEDREVDKAKAAGKDERAEQIQDQAYTLIALTEGLKHTPELIARIETLFTDDGLGAAGVVTCSTVHKAKGLEANTVFVLVDTMQPRKPGDPPTLEELNIRYVAYTRAKQELVLVTETAEAPKPEGGKDADAGHPE